jgi:hypothetical protein
MTAGRLAVDGQETNSLQGAEAASSEHPTANSVLSRPSNKRPYRQILDLLAETPRIRIANYENFN